MENTVEIKNEIVNPITEKKLPEWHFEEARGCPNVILRSSLFGVVGKGGHDKNKRPHCLEIAMAASQVGEGDTSIQFTGYRLDQNDLDLWLEILHLVRVSGSKTIQFSARSMLRALGYDSKNIGGSSIHHLISMLDRLQASNVKILTNKERTATSLIMAHKAVDTTKEIRVQLHEDVIKLFVPASWTSIQIENRRLLKSQLARWLHGFYLTHRDPFHLKITTLHKLSGSSADFSHFKYMLKSAFKELAVLPGWEMKIVPGIKDKADESDKTGEKISCKHPEFQYEEIEVERPAYVVQTRARPSYSNPIAAARLQRVKVAL
jgi:hypothetical protein